MKDDLDSLLLRLASRREETALRAEADLVALGWPIVEPLVRLMAYGDGNVRPRVAHVLARLDDVRVLENLEPLLRDEDASVRQYAVEIIQTLGASSGQRLAQRMLSQPCIPPFQRLALLRSLERIDYRDWNEGLRYPLGSLYRFCRKMQHDPDSLVQQGAKAVLEAMTLPRSALSPPALPPEQLLRPLAASSSVVSSAALLRASLPAAITSDTRHGWLDRLREHIGRRASPGNRRRV